MNVQRWNPNDEWQSLQREVNHLWDRFLDRISSRSRNPVKFIPSADIVESTQNIRVYLSLPGVIEEDIDLTVVDQSLTIRGERESPYDTERQSPRAVEERYGFFERKFNLPVEADLSTLRATYDAGVLTITVLKIHRSHQSPNH